MVCVTRACAQAHMGREAACNPFLLPAASFPACLTVLPIALP